MESNGKCLFWQKVRDFKSLGHVIPNLYGLVFRAGNNELLPDADIETSDLLRVVLAVNEIELWLLVCTVVEWDFNFHDLLVFGHKVDIIL